LSGLLAQSLNVPLAIPAKFDDVESVDVIIERLRLPQHDDGLYRAAMSMKM